MHADRQYASVKNINRVDQAPNDVPEKRLPAFETILLKQRAGVEIHYRGDAPACI
jgi:hypothetical protein